jgi:2'-5' RNA ligase
MEPARLRLFVGVTIPRGHLERVDEQIREFRDKAINARWIDLDNQHVTLKFLGSTPEDRLGDIRRTCSMVASSHEAVSVTLTRTGAFPSVSRVRVLWVGIDDPDSLMARVAADLDQAFEPLGFAPEGRAYTPHLTLCRFKIPVPLKSGLPAVDASELGPFEIESIDLFRSHLSPKGARYERLDSYPLRPR